MYTEKLFYFHEETKCHGFIAYDETVEAKRPAILVAHAIRGQDDFARKKALELAQIGYIGFAVDIYGDGKSTTSNEEATELIKPFFFDRILLKERIKAAFDFLSEHPKVDRNKIGAIGFCFGGLAVYELFRSGENLQGVAAFHAVFRNEKEGKSAKTFPTESGIKGSILILHGNEDPLVPDEDLKRVREEFTKAKVDWQIHIYGNTKHAFTNPMANDPEGGIMYSEISAKRSWRSMQNFFSDIFNHI